MVPQAGQPDDRADQREDRAGTEENLLPNPVVVVDLTANQAVAGRSPDPGQFDDAAWQDLVQNRLARPLIRAARAAADRRKGLAEPLVLDDGTRKIRLLARIEPISVDQLLVGAMIVFPTATEFGDLDHLTLDSAKLALNIQMMRDHVRYRAETLTQTDLFMELVERRWRNADDLIQRAHRAGLSLTGERRMVVMDFSGKPAARGGAVADVARAVSRMLRQGSGHRAISLGVEHFGQTGTIGDLYRHFGIDARSIAACVMGLRPGAPPCGIVNELQEVIWAPGRRTSVCTTLGKRDGAPAGIVDLIGSFSARGRRGGSDLERAAPDDAAIGA